MGYFSSIYAAGLPHRAVAVYMYLQDRCDRESKCWPSLATIARELGLSRSTVKRAMKDLEGAGHLQREVRMRENGANSSNMHYLT